MMLTDEVRAAIANARSSTGLAPSLDDVHAAVMKVIHDRGVALLAGPAIPVSAVEAAGLMEYVREEVAVRRPGQERWQEIVSDSLAATTEGTDWAEAPEPSDEPGSPYVVRLTNEILARLVKP